MNLIPTQAHGILDYSSVATMLAAPRMLGWSGRIRWLVTGAAAMTLGYSLLTRYELGLAKVLPMEAHLALDALSGALFCGTPVLLRDDDQAVLAALFGFGVFELVVVMLSDSSDNA